MKLYVDAQYLSPYAMTVFVALRAKQKPFETVAVNLQRHEQRAEGFARHSATQRVPTIDDAGFTLSESSAICEYLEDRYPDAPIYPATLQAKARAREIQAWLRSDLLPLRQERSTEVVFLQRTPPTLSDSAQLAADKLITAAERWLPPGQASLFDRWSIADTDLALMLQRLIRAGDPVPERLKTFADTQWQHPAVQAWQALPRPGL